MIITVINVITSIVVSVEEKNMKKAFFGIAVLVLVIILIVVVMLMKPKATTLSGPQNLAIPTPVLIPKDSQGKTYKDSFFAMHYPKEWTVSTKPLLGGGQLVHFQPLSVPPETPYPSLTVSVLTTPESTKTMSSQGQILKGLGLEEQSAKMGTVNIKKYSGVLTQPLQTGATPTFIQQTTILYPTQDVMYVLTYKYQGDRPDQMYESQFNTMLGSFVPQL